MLELTRQAKRIESRGDLIRFIESLAKFVGDHPDEPGEELNLDIGEYLGAMARWTSDMNGYYVNQGEEPPVEPTWRTIAEILLAALIYE